MLIPREDIIQGYLETLQHLRQNLSPSDLVTKTMLADALRGEYSKGLHGEIQRKLMLLHVAQTQIEQAIETLLTYQKLN